MRVYEVLLLSHLYYHSALLKQHFSFPARTVLQTVSIFNRLISCFKQMEAHASIFFSHASNMWSLMCGSSSCRVWFSVFLFLVLGPCFLLYNVVLTTDPHPLKWFYLGGLLRDLI